MTDFRTLRPGVRAYVGLVVAVGATALTYSVRKLYLEPLDQQWLILAALTILTGSFSVKVPSINAYISVSEAFVFASVLLFGPEAGTVTVLLECLVILLWMRPQGRPVYRLAFNIAAPAVSIWISGKTFYSISTSPPYSRLTGDLPGLQQLFVPLFTFTVLYFMLNSWLVAFAVGLENRTSARGIWWKNFAWLSVNYFSGASVAALIVTYTRHLQLSTLIIIVPLLVVSYLTFRTAMGRVEDSYNHVKEVNRLYLSTIETLAMAIDAKDQITHGHIRRVQAYAVGLASRIGVSDEKLIKAIEAAALLHDMGKLAVPEYILNKPGKLTAAEFDKMKLHASIGADILSAIDFPYPVVPIVRHHHENWDGSGYPTGIKGTDIPIGARILSVVDCFDALTSDRPYRPKLSDEAAIEILLNRRATMYDPLVVDAFIRVYKELAPAPPLPALPRNALHEITSSIHTQGSQTTAMSKREPLPADSKYSIEEVLRGIREQVDFSTAITFAYDTNTDEIVTVASFGNAPVPSFRMALGEKLSGWVAANRRSIVNSDPRLDLGDLADAESLQSTLSVPLEIEGQLIGVLTLYSSRQNGFDWNHQHFVEKTGIRLAIALNHARLEERSIV